MLVAAVTPRRAQEYSIDLGATLELIDFLGDSGVAGIVLLGSTGEFVHFALDDRRHMVNFAAKRSRVPMLVNVSYSTLDGAVELAREAASAGIAGVLLMPPYYFPHKQEEILAFYQAYADAIDGLIPTYLYNIPSCTSDIASSTAARLLSDGRFAGIKDSSGSAEFFRELFDQYSGAPFTFLSGQERLYAEQRRSGAAGAVSGVASALPELMVAFDRAIVADDTARIQQLEARLNEFLAWADQFPWPTAAKEALKQRKLKSGALANPLPPDLDKKLQQFAEWFRGWLPGVLRECKGKK